LIVIISGPGGVGKGTVVDEVLKVVPDLHLSRSWTTRPQRPAEPDDAYQFVSHEAFQKRIAEGGFLEWTESASMPGHLYGTPSLTGRDHDVVLEIDLDGARQVKGVHPEAVLILLVAPSREAQERRLRRRGDDDVAVAHRLELGEQEERVGRQMADYVVINDDIDRAAGEVAGIIAGRRAGRL
jgi:guanylate kinase